MAAQTNLQKDILVLNLEEQLMEIAKEMYGKELSALTDQETYYAVLILTKRLMAVSDCNEGEKKVYYISAEFLIGKLLSNNLINLGVYDKMSDILEKYGKKLSVIEEVEPEPSLGNGGLGRLVFPEKESDLIIILVCLSRYLRISCRQQRKMPGSRRIPG